MFIVYIPTHFNNTFKASFSNKKHTLLFQPHKAQIKSNIFLIQKLALKGLLKCVGI